MVCKLFCKERSCPIKKAIVFKSQTEAWTDLSSSGMIYIVTIFSVSVFGRHMLEYTFALSCKDISMEFHYVALENS